MKYGAYIIGCTDCGEEVCAASGRISTQSGTALEIFERSHDKEKNSKLINKVTKSGHTSTIEHIFFNVAFVYTKPTRVEYVTRRFIFFVKFFNEFNKKLNNFFPVFFVLTG